MKATFVELRKRTGDILRALNRKERVTLFYRGKPKAVIAPLDEPAGKGASVSKDHPAIGLWADRADMKDPSAYVRRLRKGRFHGH